MTSCLPEESTLAGGASRAIAWAGGVPTTVTGAMTTHATTAGHNLRITATLSNEGARAGGALSTWSPQRLLSIRWRIPEAYHAPMNAIAARITAAMPRLV